MQGLSKECGTPKDGEIPKVSLWGGWSRRWYHSPSKRWEGVCGEALFPTTGLTQVIPCVVTAIIS